MRIFKTKDTPRIRDYVELFTKVEKVIESLDNFTQVNATYRYLHLFDKFLDNELFEGRIYFNKGTVRAILKEKSRDLRLRMSVREAQLFENHISTKNK